jgi:peptide/nickel transport system permease protein
MSAFAIYAGKRLLQFALVVFIGINLAFVITHSTPIDPVEQTVAAATSFGSTSPEAIEMMRRSLRELYGLGGSPWSQYVVFWKRILVGDFGPSLSAFPTPVSVLINRALPWTIGLLTVSTLLAWVLGNLLGGLAGYYRDSKALKITGIVAMGVHPIPYYIVAFVLLVGGWFMGMRSLVSNIVTEDYVTYAELAGVSRRRILVAYVMRNALVPQLTGLAMSLGAIFNGAIITEQVFGYPGIGTLLVSAVHAGDYSLVIGIASVSIIAVSVCVLVIDLLYPLLDPRVKLA